MADVMQPKKKDEDEMLTQGLKVGIDLYKQFGGSKDGQSAIDRRMEKMKKPDEADKQIKY